jgi:hypothetical protein
MGRKGVEKADMSRIKRKVKERQIRVERKEDKW